MTLWRGNTNWNIQVFSQPRETTTFNRKMEKNCANWELIHACLWAMKVGARGKLLSNPFDLEKAAEGKICFLSQAQKISPYSIYFTNLYNDPKKTSQLVWKIPKVQTISLTSRTCELLIQSIIPDDGIPMMAWSVINNELLQNSPDKLGLAQNAIDIKCSRCNKNVIAELNSETKRQHNYSKTRRSFTWGSFKVKLG